MVGVYRNSLLPTHRELRCRPLGAQLAIFYKLQLRHLFHRLARCKSQSSCILNQLAQRCRKQWRRKRARGTSNRSRRLHSRRLGSGVGTQWAARWTWD